MHPGPGNQLALLAFTAPTADNYTFAGQFADQDIAGGGGVEVAAMLGNGTVLLPVTFMPAVSNPVAINFSRSLAAGEKVYFALGANGHNHFDSTGIQLNVTDTAQSASVPEPASIAFVGLGAVAIWLKRRRS